MRGMNIGLMGMATFTENTDIVASEFNYLKSCFDKLNEQGASLQTLSMGMSGDYPIAIDHGSTMVRIGRLIGNFVLIIVQQTQQQ